DRIDIMENLVSAARVIQIGNKPESTRKRVGYEVSHLPIRKVEGNLGHPRTRLPAHAVINAWLSQPRDSASNARRIAPVSVPRHRPVTHFVQRHRLIGFTAAVVLRFASFVVSPRWVPFDLDYFDQFSILVEDLNIWPPPRAFQCFFPAYFSAGVLFLDLLDH